MLKVCEIRRVHRSGIVNFNDTFSGVVRRYASTTQGDTQNASSMATPSPKASDSAAEGDVKSSRATDGRSPEKGGSVSNPISKENQEAGQVGTDEEGTDPIKSDPHKPAAQKREETLKQGETPLDPADK